MYTKRSMSLYLIVRWTTFTSLVFLVSAVTPVFLHVYLGFTPLAIPWSLVALVGTAVAFLISFQNNAAYDRVWEARKIWGGIVNSTRTFGVFTRDMVENDSDSVKTLIYRHRAWLTALRFSLREHKSWEIPRVVHKSGQKRFDKLRYNPERVETLEDSLKPLLSEQDFQTVMKSPNKQSAVLALQSKHLTAIKSAENIWQFSYLQIEDLIKELYTLQGKAERIKNFPYPRQYFTLGLYLTWTFILLLPYAIIPEFTKFGQALSASTNVPVDWFTIASVPFIVCVSWIFHTMGRMGRAGENPFEGTIHDVPISTMARTLEIELSHLLEEPAEKRPKPFPSVGDVQM